MALSKIQSESIDLADNFAGMRFGGTASDNALDDYEEGTFTPTISGVTLGNGTLSGRYTKIGDTVIAWVSFIMGSTTSISNLNNLGGMPFTSSSTNITSGFANILEAATAEYLGTYRFGASATSGDFRVYKADGTYVRSTTSSSTVPFTWGTNDRYDMCVQYKAA